MENLEIASETLLGCHVIVRSALLLLIIFARNTGSLRLYSASSAPALRNIIARHGSSKAINGSFQFDHNQNLNGVK